ncbi:MAG: hypothetical protein ACYSOF_06615, partial [Planctomycetota bacterium]
HLLTIILPHSLFTFFVTILGQLRAMSPLEHVNLFCIRLYLLRLRPSALKILANDGINYVFRLDGLVLMTA